jgi:predicted flap endonuclease-1-like 5' DNA nuclease
MAKIGEIEGIGPVFREKLEKAGVLTTETLLEKGAAQAGRAALAASTDIEEKRIMTFVSRADFMRIKGVGRQFSELLQNVDIHTVDQLAAASADDVNAAMTKVNDVKKLTKVVPSVKQIQGFIDIAKGLDAVVSV